MVGEPSPFFESSSELPISFACRNGKPRLNRLDASLLVLVLGDEVLAVEFASREDSFDRFPYSNKIHINILVCICYCHVYTCPYLFFKYRAHELNAAPSLSSDAVDVVAERNGDASRAFNACDDRLRAKSLLPLLLPAVLDKPP